MLCGSGELRIEHTCASPFRAVVKETQVAVHPVDTAVCLAHTGLVLPVAVKMASLAVNGLAEIEATACSTGAC